MQISRLNLTMVNILQYCKYKIRRVDIEIRTKNI